MPTFVAVLTHPFIQNLNTRLKQPLPGIEAQFEMAHINREKIDISNLNISDYRNSAVLLLLIKRGADFIIPLTERHSYKGVHSGQISLPGGKQDLNDASLMQTALRECKEEIGLGDYIEVLGELTPVFIPVSKFIVHPYVAVFNSSEPMYNLDATEVKSLLELSTADLINPALVNHTTVEPSPGYKLKTPYFDVQGKIVWGATAMILSEFKKLLY